MTTPLPYSSRLSPLSERLKQANDFIYLLFQLPSVELSIKVGLKCSETQETVAEDSEKIILLYARVTKETMKYESDTGIFCFDCSKYIHLIRWLYR